MGTFEQKVDEVTGGERRKVLGVVCLGVGKDGRRLISYASGKTSLAPDAPDITESSILTLASATKLITALAALRLVQNGTISLDDPSIIEHHLPELCALPIISSTDPLTLSPRTKPLTLRALLTHSSGSGLDILSPVLQAWRKSRGEELLSLSAGLPEAVCTPGLFEPGEGWAYGGGADWAGLLIERVSGLTLGEFVHKEIFGVLGCDERVGFDRKKVETMEGGVVGVVMRTADGKLVPVKYPPVEQKSERGGGGLYASSQAFLSVLADLISPTPKLLTQEMLDLLFAAQFVDPSPPLAALREASPVFNSMTGALTGVLPPTAINYALGGLLITEDNPELGKTGGTMTWGGATGCFWFANRELGVAGWFGGSIFPPGDTVNGELMRVFVKEVWKRAGERVM